MSGDGTKFGSKPEHYKQRFSGWVFTWNNYPDDWEHELAKWPKIYIIAGKQLGDNCGTRHLQGFVYLLNAQCYAAVRKLAAACWWEPQGWNIPGATIAKTIKHYKKQDANPFEQGQIPEQNNYTDLADICENIRNGTTNIDMIRAENDIMYHKYRRVLEKVQSVYYNTQSRTKMTEGLWIYAPTNVAKSHIAHKYAGDDFYNKPKDRGWWDNYKQERVVIINDINNAIKFGTLMRMVDKGPYTVSRRHHCPMPFMSERVIITSNMSPEEFYKQGTGADFAQFYRRFVVMQWAEGEWKIRTHQ